RRLSSLSEPPCTGGPAARARAQAAAKARAAASAGELVRLSLRGFRDRGLYAARGDQSPYRGLSRAPRQRAARGDDARRRRLDRHVESGLGPAAGCQVGLLYRRSRRLNRIARISTWRIISGFWGPLAPHRLSESAANIWR